MPSKQSIFNLSFIFLNTPIDILNFAAYPTKQVGKLEFATALQAVISILCGLLFTARSFYSSPNIRAMETRVSDGGTA
jgi:hypothetical protein